MTEPAALERFNLDPRQLARIEAVHGGFLYQHLYAAACLFLAARAGVTHVVVESDEDVELVRPQERIYTQIKMRAAPLIFSDIDGALKRFAAIRTEHAEGRRGGACRFAIVSNSAPGPDLGDRIRQADWPADVAVLCPGSAPIDDALPPPPASISEAFEVCRALAETLPLAILAPETLVWKLAGRIMAASGGVGPNADHSFVAADLPALFEQLVIQLQDFPAPPLRYRPQEGEPSLVSDQRVRLVVGFSGAGKTSWVSQSALHTTDRLFVALGNIKPLVEMATDELFHEMGYMQEISDYLVQASTDETISAEDRFWALDGLVFAHFKDGDDAEIAARLDRMDALVRENKLGLSERLAVGMKRMLFAARAKDAGAVRKIMDELSRVLPQTPQHLRVAKYNYAHALYELGMMEECTVCTLDLIIEYYDQLGLTIGDVMAKNPEAIVPLLKKGESHTDDLKHLADALDLQSKAVKAMGNFPGLAPIHAMKFYSMAQSLESFVRVGQDLVDDFIGRHDYIGARDVIERNLMPTIVGLKLAGRVIPVRSQYAVVLAYCGAINDAEAEMARLAPYESGLDAKGQWELQNQRALIGFLKLNPPPPQWEMPAQLSGPLAKK